MSSPSSSSQTAAPSAIFKSMLDAALIEYMNKTGKDLQAVWLASELQTCESVGTVLDLLRDQAKSFEQSDDQKLMSWIDPLVQVLHTFSDALGDGVSLAFPPAKVIFTGIGVLLGAAKDARASHGAIIDLFERIESFFKRLEVYTQITLTGKMAEVLVKIVIELLSILSIATKEVSRRRAKLFARKLLGRTDIEDALKRLDCLIQEEFKMVMAQVLKVTTEVKDGAEKTNIVVQQMSNDIGEVKRDVMEVKWTQIAQDILKWFSPPDPSTNYNIAYKAHHEGTAAWFFQGTIFKDWLSIGSLLWIHGKPGSGKSILCSVIIKRVISLRDAGLASLAYFYFDFRDKDKKQDFRNLVTSLLVQLSTSFNPCSDPCCEIISRIYSTHGMGAQQPSDHALKTCLRRMLLVPAQQPIYIIVDALDECPNAGMPSPREEVLNLLEALAHLRLPNLHICVTSRLEVDIKKTLEQLPHSAVSLHDESGQQKDISNYLSSTVEADRKMWSWRAEEKKLVVTELSNKADGMFRWVFCQLEVLRDCFPVNIRRTLDQLPKSLDETYVRVLSQIPEVNQAHAHRMLQCLTVAVRPLYVEELAELLAFDFDAAEGEIPKYRAAWRLGDQTQAVLATCSSLVTIIRDTWGRQVVQFSHFSVKEFLISNRLTPSLGDISRYHICPISAHTILTQACLGLLLHLDDHVDKETIKRFPLIEYAARHWVEHARFEDVASRVKGGMETLFEPGKPHFAAWIDIYDLDTPILSRRFLDLEISPESKPNPLYYSAFCGFYDLVQDLAVKYPQSVNAVYGQYGFPLLAALSKDHGKIAELLLKHGANVDARETTGETTLLKVLSQPQHNLVNIVKFLLKHGADVNARDGLLRSSLHLAEDSGQLQLARILLEHNANANFQNDDGKAPLHLLSQHLGHSEGDILRHALLLLKHAAEVDIRDKDNKTPLHLAIQCERFKLAGILLEHGADATAENNLGETPLHILSGSRITNDSEGDVLNLVRHLLKLGAKVNGRDKDEETPLHLAIRRDQLKLAGILLEHGADANTVNIDGMTPLHISSDGWIEEEGDVPNYALSLLKHGADVNRRDKDNETPLHLAIRWDRSELAGILESSVSSGYGGTYPGPYTLSQKRSPTPLQPAYRDDQTCAIAQAFECIPHQSGANNSTLPLDAYPHTQAPDFVQPSGSIATPGCPGGPEPPHTPLIQSFGGPTYELGPPHGFERPPLQTRNLSALPSSAKPQQMYDVCLIQAHQLSHALVSRPYPPRVGQKKALLIGINYSSHRDHKLRPNRAIHDAQEMARFLQEHFGFHQNNIRLLTDTGRKSQPTKANILVAMRWLVEGAQPGDSLFFYFSGHATIIMDKDGDELDGYDECICAVDYDDTRNPPTGIVLDDTMHDILVKPLPQKCRLTAVLDCCQFGTLLDLPFIIYDSYGRTRQSLHVKSSGADVISLSACVNNFIALGPHEGGALGEAFIEYMKGSGNHGTYLDMIHNLRACMSKKNLEQRPQLSSSHRIDINERFTIIG